MTQCVSELEFALQAASFLASGTVGVAWSQEKSVGAKKPEKAQRIERLKQERDKIRQELEQPQKQPEGVTKSTAPRGELPEQPTRNMRESLESLPGMTVRQGEEARDFISIRGSK